MIILDSIVEQMDDVHELLRAAKFRHDLPESASVDGAKMSDQEKL